MGQKGDYSSIRASGIDDMLSAAPSAGGGGMMRAVGGLMPSIGGGSGNFGAPSSLAGGFDKLGTCGKWENGDGGIYAAHVYRKILRH